MQAPKDERGRRSMRNERRYLRHSPRQWPEPFQVGREGIDPPGLPHEGHARCRADSRIGEGDPRIFTIGVRFWRKVIGSGQPYPNRPRLVTAAIYVWTLALFAQRISRTHLLRYLRWRGGYLLSMCNSVNGCSSLRWIENCGTERGSGSKPVSPPFLYFDVGCRGADQLQAAVNDRVRVT